MYVSVVSGPLLYIICASQFSKRLSNINLVVKLSNILDMSFVSSSKNHTTFRTLGVSPFSGEKDRRKIALWTPVQIYSP